MQIPPPAAIVGNWQPPNAPDPWQAVGGQHVRLEPLSVDHAEALFAAYTAEGGEENWKYLSYGPFETEARLAEWLREFACGADPVFISIRDLRSANILGVASFLRINPDAGVIEVGHIHYSPALQGTVGATEAMFLMMRWVFQQGYRRYEWKCHAMNTASRRAASRLGFSYEGTFYQHTISKGRNRDTAWFAILDWQWSSLEKAFMTWLSHENFDAEGKQKTSLRDLTSRVLYAQDPGYTALNAR